MDYRINPFVHIFKKGKLLALFNSLTLATIYLKNSEYQRIINNPSPALMKANFFVKHNFDAKCYFNNCINQSRIDNNIGLAYFLVTSSCNYNCEYCFIESRFSQTDNVFMSENIARKGVKLMKRNMSNCKIIFYGGEPLLNFGTIKATVKEIKKSKLNTTYSVITNGSIISDEIVKFLKENKFSISVSLDGLKKNNDKARKDTFGKGTYDKVISTLEILHREGLKFGISCTISEHNMDKPDEILNVLEKHGIRGFGYNLLSENSNVQLSKYDFRKMVKNILHAENKVIEKEMVEDRIINRKLRPFIEQKNWTRDCAGYGKQIIIAPDGKVGVCHGLYPDYKNNTKNNYFDIDVDYQGLIKNHPTWIEWFNRIPSNMPQCWNCFGLGLCGGGCAKNSLVRHGSIWDVDEEICILTKESIPWVIWKYYDMKNGDVKLPKTA